SPRPNGRSVQGRIPRRYTGTVTPKAVCLLSGGLDSATCLALARREGYETHALSFDYGQRHRVELEAAARIATSCGGQAIMRHDHRARYRVPRGRSCRDLPEISDSGT